MLTHQQQFASERLITFQKHSFLSRIRDRETDMLSNLRAPVAIIQRLYSQVVFYLHFI